MKILSNFDTWRAEQLLKEAEHWFGEGNAMLIRRSALYFYQKIWIPVFGYLVILIIGAYMVLMVEWVPVEAQRAFLGLMVFIALLMFMKLWKRRVDYKMDYLLITPKEITKYDQWGMFHRDVENIPVNKIKSISLGKHWFFQSLFDIGSLTFLAEWDADEWDIVMDYIDGVTSTERKIKGVLGMLGV